MEWWASTEWWTMLWAAVQAIAVVAALVVGVVQLRSFRSGERLRATMTSFEQWDDIFKKFKAAGFVIAPPYDQIREYNRDHLKDSLKKSDPDDTRETTVELFNYMSRSATLFEKRIVDRRLFLDHLDNAILGTYVMMEPAFNELKNQLGAELEGVRQLAAAAQEHYRARNGPEEYFKQFKIS